MTATTIYTLAASHETALIHAGVLEAMAFHGETPQYLAGVPIRFFGLGECITCDHCGATIRAGYDPAETCDDCGAILPDDSMLDIVEIESALFLDEITRGVPFTYERHTVRENGASQIILTLQEST